MFSIDFQNFVNFKQKKFLNLRILNDTTKLIFSAIFCNENTSNFITIIIFFLIFETFFIFTLCLNFFEIFFFEIDFHFSVRINFECDIIFFFSIFLFKNFFIIFLFFLIYFFRNLNNDNKQRNNFDI